MKPFVKLYSDKKNEIKRFISNYYLLDNNILDSITDDTLELKIDYKNPVEMSDIIGIYIENIDSYMITMWISIDEDVLINVTNSNSEDIIRYLFERYPY